MLLNCLKKYDEASQGHTKNALNYKCMVNHSAINSELILHVRKKRCSAAWHEWRQGRNV